MVFFLVRAREKGVLDHVLVWGLLLVLESAFLTLSITIVEIVTMNEVLALSSLLLLSWKLHVRHILRLLLLANDRILNGIRCLKLLHIALESLCVLRRWLYHLLKLVFENLILLWRCETLIVLIAFELVGLGLWLD